MKAPSHTQSPGGWTLRDVVQGILGPEPPRRDVDAYLRVRLEQIGRLERSAVERCLELLLGHAREGSEDAEALEALVLVGLAHPRVCTREGIALANYGRRAAALYERMEREERARGLLVLLSERMPEHRGIERDLAALLRRRGETEELIDRYMSRAQERVDQGEPAQAIPLLQEVLLVDPARKDVARLIRDLRFDEGERVRRRRRRRRLATAVASLSMVASLLFLREQRVGEAFGALPRPEVGELTSMETRLTQLERFIGRYPVWHGALSVLEERARLRAAIEAIRSRAETDREREEQIASRRQIQAESVLKEGRASVEAGQWRRALQQFELALELGQSEWSERPWAERNIEALRALLEESP